MLVAGVVVGSEGNSGAGRREGPRVIRDCPPRSGNREVQLHISVQWHGFCGDRRGPLDVLCFGVGVIVVLAPSAGGRAVDASRGHVRKIVSPREVSTRGRMGRWVPFLFHYRSQNPSVSVSGVFLIHPMLPLFLGLLARSRRRMWRPALPPVRLSRSFHIVLPLPEISAGARGDTAGDGAAEGAGGTPPSRAGGVVGVGPLEERDVLPVELRLGAGEPRDDARPPAGGDTDAAPGVLEGLREVVVSRARRAFANAAQHRVLVSRRCVVPTDVGVDGECAHTHAAGRCVPWPAMRVLTSRWKCLETSTACVCDSCVRVLPLHPEATDVILF